MKASIRWFGTKPRSRAAKKSRVEMRSSASRSSTHPEDNRVSITLIAYPDGPDAYPEHFDITTSADEAETFARRLLDHVEFLRDHGSTK